ncbi:MAG: tetratricopeptide (TPR) repeat protein, partial [Nonlabens sp.]|jgi:tetratricopeptide (TPR) repeat protein
MVDAISINKVLAQPETIHVDHLTALEDAIKEYPYFQAVRSMYLKGLKNENSPLYNKELQRTAAHTTDRSVLFDFITSESFIQNKVSEQIKLLQQEERTLASDSISGNTLVEEDLNASKNFTQVIDADLFEKKKEISIEEAPLEFDKNETYSFSQWLQLSRLKPIDRKELPQEKNSVILDGEVKKAKKLEEEIQEVDDRARKMARIDQFLAEKPKIKPRKSSSNPVNITNHYQDPSQFMTETLAKVYLAQKNYSKALKAYEVLVLQHPEKSAFFADQIQEIKNLQSNPT